MFKDALTITTIGVFIAHYLSDITGIEQYAISNGLGGMLVLFIFYYIFVLIALQISKMW